MGKPRETSESNPGTRTRCFLSIFLAEMVMCVEPQPHKGPAGATALGNPKIKLVPLVSFHPAPFPIKLYNSPHATST